MWVDQRNGEHVLSLTPFSRCSPADRRLGAAPIALHKYIKESKDLFKLKDAGLRTNGQRLAVNKLRQEIKRAPINGGWSLPKGVNGVNCITSSEMGPGKG